MPDDDRRAQNCVSQRRRSEFRWQLCAMCLVACFAVVLTGRPSFAQTGSIRVFVTKASLVAGVGAGHGVLSYRGRDYPFRVSGLSLGLSAGASINRLFGRVSYLDRLEDFPGIYSAVGLGLALSGGVGGVQLKNANGVIISLEAAKFGLEASANLSAVKITLD